MCLHRPTRSEQGRKQNSLKDCMRFCINIETSSACIECLFHCRSPATLL